METQANIHPLVTMNTKHEKRLLTPEEVGTACGVTINTVRQWKHKGCPYTESRPYGIGKTSSRPRFDLEEVKSWLAEQNRKEEK